MGKAVKELKQIPFGHLIGAPMTAAIESQALAAKSTIDFIQQVGFVSSGDAEGDGADMGQVRSVTFQYTKKNEQDGEESFVLAVPILTITPIPFIRIDEMTIDFKAKLTDMVETKSASNFGIKTDASVGYGAFWSPVKANFRVSATHKTSNSRNANEKREYTMDVHVRAVQDEMPAGLSRVLDVLEDAITNVSNDQN